MKSDRYWVYVLRSVADGRCYVGQTRNLADRVRRHNEGLVRSTRERRPLELVHFEVFATRGEAVRRERELKSPEFSEFKGRLRSRGRGCSSTGRARPLQG